MTVIVEKSGDWGTYGDIGEYAFSTRSANWDMMHDDLLAKAETLQWRSYFSLQGASEAAWAFRVVTASLMSTPFLPSTPSAASTLTREHSTPSSRSCNAQSSFMTQRTPTRDPAGYDSSFASTPGRNVPCEYCATLCQTRGIS
jgi:hypothetical protein